MKIPLTPDQIFTTNQTPEKEILQEKIALPLTEKIEYCDGKKTLVVKGDKMYEVDGVSEYGAGIYCYDKGFLYPTKGHPDYRKYPYVNQAKRFFIRYVEFLATKEVLFCFSLLLFTRWKTKIKVLNKFLRMYNEIAYPTIHHAFFKDEYYSKPVKALRKLIVSFLTNLGVDEHRALDFAHIFATMLEYDQAYRYRMEDILSETNTKKLQNAPVREVRRLISIFVLRGGNHHTTVKFESIGRILAFILLHPKIKKAFRSALDTIDWQDLCLDEADRYHVLRFDQYDYMGRTIEGRWQEFLKLHGGEDGLPKMYYADFE